MCVSHYGYMTALQHKKHIAKKIFNLANLATPIVNSFLSKLHAGNPLPCSRQCKTNEQKGRHLVFVTHIYIVKPSHMCAEGEAKIQISKHMKL